MNDLPLIIALALAIANAITPPPPTVLHLDWHFTNCPPYCVGPNYRIAIDQSTNLLNWRPVCTNWGPSCYVTSSTPWNFYRTRPIDD